MFDRQWVFDIKHHNEYINFCEEKGLKGSFVDEIMYKRGFDGKTGGVESLSDPYILPDMAKAVDRILTAVEDGEKIAIFGDYDADGVTATAVLYHFLQNIAEADVVAYIPNRLTEGYGMSANAIDTLCEEGVTLIVTVDNGILAFEQIEHAKNLGIDVVVTDHHKCGEVLPECCAVVNPCILKEDTPLNYLCGAGVSFTLVRALADEIGVYEEINRYIPIVMIGTLGDVVPLSGDNRIIVKYGMENLRNFDWIGIETLVAKITEGKNNPKISSMFVSFQLVPKINAAGRIGNAMRAFELIVCEDESVAEKLAADLISDNAQRQITEAEIAEKALQEENLKTKDTDLVVVALGDDWHHGVIGIVASRLTEKHKKPSFVLSVERNEDGKLVARGSARSVKGFNLHSALTECAHLLERFGGHEMAAGLTIRVDNIPKFIDSLNEYGKKIMQQQEPANEEIDAVVLPHEITVEAVERLADLEPFGQGNEQPVLCVRNLKPISCTKVGESGKHLKFSFCAENPDGKPFTLEGIAFSQAAYENMIKSIGNTCSILCRAEINNWQGRKSVSLIISDIHDDDYNIDNILRCVYNSDYITGRGFVIDRKMLVIMYKLILQYGEGFKFNDLFRIRENMRQHGVPCTWYEIRSGLDIFTELGLVTRKDKQTFSVAKNSEKVDLTKSLIYKMVQVEV